MYELLIHYLYMVVFCEEITFAVWIEVLPFTFVLLLMFVQDVWRSVDSLEGQFEPLTCAMTGDFDEHTFCQCRMQS